MLHRIIIASVTAGLLTYYLNHSIGRGPVFASSLVAVLSGVLLPRMFEDGAALAVVATCSSYAGMAARSRVANWREMILVSAIAGLLYWVASDVFIGVGGKLGTIAAIAVISLPSKQIAAVRAFVFRSMQGSSTFSDERASAAD